MSKNLIYLCKNKLIGIDRILAILLELKKIYPKINFVIVFLNNKHIAGVKKNYNIWNAIRSMDARIYVMRGRNKFITLARLLKFLLHLALKDNIIIKDADVLPLHNVTMRILKKISRLTEIAVYLSVQFPDYLKKIYIQSVLKREREDAPKKLDVASRNYDYFLSVLNPRQFKDFFNIEISEQKMVKVGYTYRLSGWQEYADGAIRKNRVINEGEYFFYILHCTYQRRPYLNEPDMIELVEESLSVLKKYNDRVKTIFKPHTVTDINRFKEALKKTNYSNYVIDYSHPYVLSSKAKFVFGNFFSSIMFNAYYLGKPTVEYCQYDPELFVRLGRQSIGGKFCDFFIYRDKKKLEEVLDKLINDEIRVVRDPKFIQDSYPDTPQGFYDFWHKLLS